MRYPFSQLFRILFQDICLTPIGVRDLIKTGDLRFQLQDISGNQIGNDIAGRIVFFVRQRIGSNDNDFFLLVVFAQLALSHRFNRFRNPTGITFGSLNPAPALFLIQKPDGSSKQNFRYSLAGIRIASVKFFDGVVDQSPVFFSDCRIGQQPDVVFHSGGNHRFQNLIRFRTGSFALQNGFPVALRELDIKNHRALVGCELFLHTFHFFLKIIILSHSVNS